MAGRGRLINKARDLASYSFANGEEILLDANIWLYLFPPPANPKQYFAEGYSRAFHKLLGAQAQPVLDPMVLSEYLNRYCRIEWQGQRSTQGMSFKEFRQCAYFQSVASSAHGYAKKILDKCQVHSIPADKLDICQALDDFESGLVDFNDAILVDVCKKRNLKLMTNDGDFQRGGIEILTTNRRLLRACP